MKDAIAIAIVTIQVLMFFAQIIAIKKQKSLAVIMLGALQVPMMLSLTLIAK